MARFQSKSAHKVATEVFHNYNNHPLRGDPHQKMSLYNAFFNGDHYETTYTVKDRIKQALEREPFIHKSKLNWIKTIVHIAVSGLLKERPVPIAIPTSRERKDKMAAGVATDLLTNIFDQNERNTLSDLYGGLINGNRMGTGYLHPFWNPDKYAITTKGGKSTMVGDWQLSVEDPFSVFHDPTQRKFEDLGWMIYRYMADIDELRDNNPKIADAIVEVNANEITSERFAHGKEREQTSSESVKNKALVLEQWERPSLKHPRGRKITTINGDLLADDGEIDNPLYDMGPLYMLPFIPVHWDRLPEKFLGNSSIKDLVMVQKEINLLASQIMKNARLTSAMSYLIPKGSGIKEQQLTGLPQVIYFNAQAGVAPQVVGGTPHPAYVPNYLSTLTSWIQDLGGIHEVSKAQIPERGSHMPAALYKMLVESEATRFAHNMRDFETSLKLLCMFILKLIKKKYKEIRYLNILGKDRGYELKAFMGAKLDGAWDVTMKPVSAINRSLSGKMEFMAMLADRGILQEAEEGAEWAVKYIENSEFGDVEYYRNRRKKQLIQAERFLERLRTQKKIPDILTVYNETIFIETLQDFMLTEEYDENVDDEGKNRFEEAVKLFDKNKFAKEQRKAQAMSPPQPPAPPGMGMPAPMNAGQQVMGMEAGGMQPGGAPVAALPPEGGGMPPQGM